MLPPIFPRPTIPSFTSDPLHRICGRVGTNTVPVRPQISSSSWSRCRCQQLGEVDSAGADAAGLEGSQVTGGLRRLQLAEADVAPGDGDLLVVGADGLDAHDGVGTALDRKSTRLNSSH